MRALLLFAVLIGIAVEPTPRTTLRQMAVSSATYGRVAALPPVTVEMRKGLMEIVSTTTKFPTEQMAGTMDLKADLGIDGVKRGQILAAMQVRFPKATKVSATQLSKMRTLDDLLNAAAVPRTP